MATIRFSASPVSTSTVTANLSVERPHIKKISISGFRAFPPYRPKSFEVNLGDDGKNLLLYGENGSGKTSLFRALRDLCDTSDKLRTYADHRNVFIQAEDDAIKVELTSGTPSEYRWEIGEPHPKEYTEYAGGWAHKEMYLVENHEGESPIPEIKEGLSPLDRATAHLVANDLTAAAVYLRAAFESRLRNVCDKHGIEIPFKKQIKEVKANDLWNGILARQAKRRELQTIQPTKNHLDFISSALVQKIEMMRSTILNRLSHTDSPNFAKSEVQTARAIIEELQNHPFPRPCP